MARAYARHPKQTLVISPDNASRVDLNHRIRRELQARGFVAATDHRLTVLVPRGELTGADRRWAARYDVGDRIRYTRGSRALGLGAGEYARVVDVDREQNFLTVDRTGGARRTYDPRRLHGVSVYREASRDFSVGDRVQFTAPDRGRAYRQPPARHDRAGRRRRDPRHPPGLRTRGAGQQPRAAASRPRLRGHEPQ